jgi:hypothetical protein
MKPFFCLLFNAMGPLTASYLTSWYWIVDIAIGEGLTCFDYRPKSLARRSRPLFPKGGERGWGLSGAVGAIAACTSTCGIEVQQHRGGYV